MHSKFHCQRCDSADDIRVMSYCTLGMTHLSFIRCYGCGWESEDIEIKSPAIPYENTVKATR